MTDPNVPVPQPPAPAPASKPGFALGVVGLVLDFLPFLTLIGLILSIVGKVQSKKAGVSNAPATVGIVLGIIFLVVQLVIWIIIGVSAGALVSECAQLGAGVHDVNGVTVTCGS